VQEDRTHHGRSQAFTAPATSHPPIESIRRTQTEPPHPGQLQHNVLSVRRDGGAGRRPVGPLPGEQLPRGWRGRPSMLKVLDRGSLTHLRFSRLRTVRNLQKLRTVGVRGGCSTGKILKSYLKLITPTEVNRTVAPTRRPNAELRTREHLTPGEVEALVEATKANRHGHRDAIMILVAFRHGLRAAELCDLRWDQVEFDAAVLHVRRVKNGTPSTHPLRGDELRALRRLQRESETSPFVFVSERGSPFTTAGFARMIERAAGAAGLDLKAHPHMLRHACGYALANKGHDTRAIQAWLGHRSITSTAVYTALAPNRFKDFWRD
jgi:integrase